MRDGEFHFSLALRNEKLATLLEEPSYLDWGATVLFYAALHYVEAYLSTLSSQREFRTHAARNRAIQADARIEVLWADYQSLSDWSREARYAGRIPTVAEFHDDILPSFDRIKGHLGTLVRSKVT